ncbi:zinc-binding dehydrogenase [Streptomyces sp. NBC_01637]|nr:zinc-binding dehydrogenase [Streptomyces sp. NBC_01653]WTC84446.1 zinc-binding dehydrogenase [Streptomyces sp. NBC_01653]WTD86421.1 zinc-binding dehydrogenase [Streptomyces sp. NBC_01637]WTD94103.1 zinc-binding dehydrogenase [Streptomyces sp. NBC_01637]
MFRLGQYGIDPVFPSGIGYEAAGVIEALGEGVSGLSVGEAVSVVPSFAMTDYPMHGEAVLAPADAVVAHPERLSDDRRRADAVAFVHDGLAKGELTPVIDKTFPLEAIADAYRYLEAGGQVGKIVIGVDQHGDRS